MNVEHGATLDLAISVDQCQHWRRADTVQLQLQLTISVTFCVAAIVVRYPVVLHSCPSWMSMGKRWRLTHSLSFFLPLSSRCFSPAAPLKISSGQIFPSFLFFSSVISLRVLLERQSEKGHHRSAVISKFPCPQSASRSHVRLTVLTSLTRVTLKIFNLPTLVNQISGKIRSEMGL